VTNNFLPVFLHHSKIGLVKNERVEQSPFSRYFELGYDIIKYQVENN